MHCWVGGREGVPVTPHEGQSDLNQKYTLLLPPAGENFQDAWPMAKSPSAIIETPPTWIQASKRQAEEMIYEIPTCMQQPQLERSHFSAVQDASASSFLSWGSPSFSEHHAVLWLAGEDAHSLWIFCSDPDIFSLKLMSDRKSQFPLSHSLCRSLMNVREMRMDWLLPRTLQVHATWRHTLMSRGHEVPLWQIDLFSFFFPDWGDYFKQWQID